MNTEQDLHTSLELPMADFVESAMSQDKAAYYKGLDEIICGTSVEKEDKNALRSRISENLPLDSTPIETPIHRLHGQFTARLARRKDALASRRDDYALLSSQVRGSWERFQRFHEIYVESRDAYENALDPHNIRFAAVSPPQRINLLRHQVDDDRARLEMQYAELADLELRLTTAETKCRESEADIAAATNELIMLASFGTLDDFRALMASAQLERPISRQSSVSRTPQLDIRLEQYYDKAGDVKIMGERLVELDYWFHDTLVARGLQQDRDELLSIADEDFEEDYRRKRRIAEIELTIVIAEADRLRAVCDDAKLDINAWQEDIANSYAESDKSPEGEEGMLLEPRPREAWRAPSLPELSRPSFDPEIIRGSPNTEPVVPELSERESIIANWAKDIPPSITPLNPDEAESLWEVADTSMEEMDALVSDSVAAMQRNDSAMHKDVGQPTLNEQPLELAAAQQQLDTRELLSEIPTTKEPAPTLD